MDEVTLSLDESREEIGKIIEEGESYPSFLKITKHMPMTPKQFVELIDEFYVDARNNKISRFESKWSMWSRKMNVEVRDRINSNDPEAQRLKYVIVYWTLRSELLELHYRKPKTGFALKKRRAREAKKIKLIILSDDLVNIPELDENSITQMVLRGFKNV